MTSKDFLTDSEMEWESLGGGVQRKILGFDHHIMMVKVKFATGAIGSLHRHFHTQTTYCASGKFEFTIGDVKTVIGEGDGVYIRPDLDHGVVCLEEGILIDVFSPAREDFLNGTPLSYFGNNK